MNNQTLFISFYLIFNASIIVLALYLGEAESPVVIGGDRGLKDSTSSLSYFTKPTFYILKNNLPYLHLFSKELTINSETSNSVFFRPSGSLFKKNGVPVRFTSLRGVMKRKESILDLFDDVIIDYKDTQLKSKFLVYDFSNYNIKAWKDVKTYSVSNSSGDKISIYADKLDAYTEKEISIYEGNVKGKILRKKAYEESVYFKTNHLLANNMSSKMTLTGSVEIKKQGFKATSKRGEVFLENYNKRLKYYVLYDDVVVVEKVVEENSIGEALFFERRAFAEKLEGFMSDNRIVLTGYPKVYSDGDVIKGNRITLRKDTDVIEVDDANTKFILR